MTKVLNHKKLSRLLVAGACIITLSAPLAGPAMTAVHAADAYDMSEFQGYLTDAQVRRLKHEVSFVVLRAQAGSGYHDRQIVHNIHMMNKYHIPYGVYSYSYYANPAQARGEADTLYHRAPNAKFYANDCEEDDTYGTLNASTQAWANEIKRRTNRPAVLYSGLYFMDTNLSQRTRNCYDAIWLAAYGMQPSPSYHYDLWQFSSTHYSKALGEALDADDFPTDNTKPLSFWVGNSSRRGPAKRQRSNIKPVNQSGERTMNAAYKAAIAHFNAVNARGNRMLKTLHRRERFYKAQANREAQEAGNNSSEITLLANDDRAEARAMRADIRAIENFQNRLAVLTHQTRIMHVHKHGHVKRIVKHVKVPFNNAYLRGKHIRTIKVTRRKGINYYDFSGTRKLGHIRKGTKLHVLYLRYSQKRGHIISQAVVERGKSGRPCVVTANKNSVRALK